MHGPLEKPEFAWIEPGRIVRHGTYENNDFRIRYKPVRESGSAQQEQGETPQLAQEVLTLRVMPMPDGARKQEL